MLSPSGIQSKTASGHLDPVYVVLGEDEQEKTDITLEFEQDIEESMRPFNVVRFHGSDTSLGAVLDAARTLPMLAPRRLVIILRAERLLEPARESATAQRDADSLIEFLEAPPPHATLVFVAVRLDERRRITKRLFSKATVIRCGELETVEDAARWVRARMKSENRRMSAKAVSCLSQRLGPDIVRLRDTIDRLLLFVDDATEVSENDVSEVVGPAVSHDNWAVTRAIEEGAADVALRELGMTLESGVAPYMVLGQLAWVSRSRLTATSAADGVKAVFRTDLDIKQSRGDPRILLERLVVELCSLGGR